MEKPAEFNEALMGFLERIEAEFRGRQDRSP